MVGVTGKSRACHDCRRRRVRCDFRKPACLRCEKAGITCRGYERAPIFVNRTLATPSANALSVISEIRHQSTQTTTVSLSAWLQILQRLRTEVFNPSCPPTEFRAQAWALLKDLYLPRALPVSETRLGGTTPYSWLQAVCKLRKRSDALDHSLLAFSAVQVYLAETGNATVDEGLQLYNYALQELVKDLENGRVKNIEETLAAIVVLSTCELFVFPNDQGWRAHAHGISEILRYRGSSDYTSPVWQSLCSRLRLICVLLGLTKRRALTLSTDKWRQLMCIESRAESFEGLMDLISEVPLLLEESEILLTSAKSTFSLRESTLLQSLLCVFQKLDTWQQRCRLSFAKPPYWAVPSKLHNPSDDAFTDKLFPFALEFESLNVAMPLVLNSGVMLQVLGTVLLLDAKIGSFNDQPMARDTVESRKRNPLDGQKTVTLASGTIGQKYASVSSIKAEADRLARFLCQSIEYCHRIEMGTLGPQATCHPQWAMRRYFRQARLERELEWCKNIKNMSGPGSRCGIELMLFGADESTL